MRSNVGNQTTTSLFSYLRTFGALLYLWTKLFRAAVKTAKTAPEVEAFFDVATSTLTYVVTSPGTRRCTIIDPVLDYDENSAAVSTLSADTVVRYVRENGLTVDYILETHVHADHLSGAHYLRQHLGGLVAIGAAITEVQSAVAEISLSCRRLRVTARSSMVCLMMSAGSLLVQSIFGCCMYQDTHRPASPT
jgi:beta-lactamase superfamily II metal-dependent hydrolase